MSSLSDVIMSLEPYEAVLTSGYTVLDLESLTASRVLIAQTAREDESKVFNHGNCSSRHADPMIV
jgi:hypothetical protein